MSKRLLVKLGAITAAFVIAAVPVTTVFAVDLTEATQFDDGQTHNFDNVTIAESDDGNPLIAVLISDGTTLNVSGDAESEYGPGIWAESDKYWTPSDDGWTSTNPNHNPTTVNVEGSVSGSGNGLGAVHALGNTFVKVDGDVNYNKWNENDYGYGVIAKSYYNFADVDSISEDIMKDLREVPVGEVNIGGNVISEAAGVSTNGFKVNVGGNIVADQGPAILTQNGGTIKVKGDVTGGSAGIQIIRSDDDKADYGTDLVIVEGTLKATNGSAIIFHDRRTQGGNNTNYKYPDIVLYQISASNKDSIVSAKLREFKDTTNSKDYTELSEEECQKAADAILSAINYIIRTEGDIQLSGDSLRNYDGHDTMRYGETVTASVADGYTVEGSDAVTVTKVSDGVYNITLNSQLGGITLKAVVDNSNNGQQVNIDDPDQINSQQWQNIMSQIQSQQEAASNNNSQSDNTASSDISVAATGSNGVAVATSDSATLTALSADGSAPAREVSFSMSELSTSQYQTAVVDNINNTPSGETLRIETDTAACLDSAMLEAFSAKDIDLEVVFTYNGQKLLVVIPKGYDITKLLDEKGYCGFLRLASILGSTVV